MEDEIEIIEQEVDNVNQENKELFDAYKNSTKDLLNEEEEVKGEEKLDLLQTAEPDII